METFSAFIYWTQVSASALMLLDFLYMFLLVKFGWPTSSIRAPYYYMIRDQDKLTYTPALFMALPMVIAVLGIFRVVSPDDAFHPFLFIAPIKAVLLVKYEAVTLKQLLSLHYLTGYRSICGTIENIPCGISHGPIKTRCLNLHHLRYKQKNIQS